MKHTPATRLTYSLFLIFTLVFNSIAGLSPDDNLIRMATNEPDNTQSAGILAEPLPDLHTVTSTESVQVEALDAATRNFLKGLSGTRFEVAMSVIQTVNKAGGKVVFVGSWISGKNFVDPLLGGTSDFDMRVVFEGSEELAKAKYNQLRREITNQITQRFGAQANQILRSTNIYPPEVFLEGIDDAEEAIKKLMEKRINPNLGGAMTEGLWGKGAKAFRDAYEAKAGRVVWKEGSLIRSGFADLLPVFGESGGVYTIQGSGNTSIQFAGKVEDALAKGETKSAAKSLERLRNSLKKGRDLGRFGPADYLDDFLKKCCQTLKEVNGRQILVMDLDKAAIELNKPGVRESLAGTLRRAKIEAELLLRYASETNPQVLKVIREMLQVNSGKWKRVIDAFLQYGGKVAEIGGKVRWDIALKGFFAVLLAYQVYDYHKKITEADLEGILNNALLDATMLVSAKFAVGFVPLILKAIMDDAIEYGYAIITAQQDCQDLIAGIYEVKGRESLDIDQRAERSVDQLAVQYTETPKVEAVVALHARNAAMRNGKEDPKAEKILYDRCSKEIVERWRFRRIDLIAEAIDVLKKIDTDIEALSLTGFSQPEEFLIAPGGSGTVNVRAAVEGNTDRIRQRLIEFEKKIKLLGGDENLVAVSINKRYRWMPYNLVDDVLSSPEMPLFDSEKASREFTFEGDNIENLRLEFEIEIDVRSVADDVFSVRDQLQRTYTKIAAFNINVIKTTGTVEIVGPGEAEAGKAVNLTAKLDNDLSKLKDPLLVWSDLSGGTPQQKGSSYTLTVDEGQSKTVRLEIFAKTNEVFVKVAQAEKVVMAITQAVKPASTPSQSPSPSPTTTDPAEPGKLMFGGITPDIWEVVNNERGFTMKRKTAANPRPEGCAGSATLGATITGKLNRSFTPYGQDQVTTRMMDFEAANKPWGRTAVTRPFSIGEFSGQFSDTDIIYYRGGGSPLSGYTDARIEAQGSGLVLMGGASAELFYQVHGYGCYNNSDQPFLQRQAAAAQSEVKAIINSLSLTGGVFATTPYKGPKLDGSDMPVVELVIKPDKKKLKKGEVIDVQAVVKNATAEDQPVKFEWTGDHAGAGANVQFIANKPGKQTLSVAAAGPNYPIGSASVEFEIADLKVEFKKTAPAAAKVSVGIPVSFSAQLLSEGQSVSGNYIYRFEGSPAVTFDANESAVKQTKAKFSQPGKEKVWVEVFEKKGEVLEPVATSEQIEVEVVAPELKIAFDQAKAMVGKPVKAKVEVTPADLKEIDFRWETTSNAKLTLQSPNAREITFIPQDEKPVTVTVYARVPVVGDDLGKHEATITAEKYVVNVSVLGAEGPRPQIWREGEGLVTVENAIAVHQTVGLRADLKPAFPDARYEWTLNEDSHFSGGRTTQQIRVSRSQTGTGEATVVVRDRNGVELGRGSATFNVTVSQAEVDQAKRMGSPAGKLDLAKNALKKGQLDEAIAYADEAQKLAPRNAEARTLSQKLKKDKALITTQLQKARTLMDQKRFLEASNELNIARNLHNLYPPIVEFEKDFNEKWRSHEQGIVAAMGNIRLANENRDFKKAIQLADELRANYRLVLATEKDLQLYEQVARTREAEKDRQRAILKRGEEKYRAFDFEGAYEDLGIQHKNGDFYEHWNVNTDPEPPYYQKLRDEVFAKLKRINELMIGINSTVEATGFNKAAIEKSIRDCDEVLGLQPVNATARRAKELLSDKLRAGPNAAKAAEAMTKGQSLLTERKYRDAIKEFDNAIKLDPRNASAYRLRGRAKRENGDLAGARKDFDKAIELDPNQHLSYLGRGVVKEMAGDKTGALSDYDRAISIEPNYASSYASRGSLKNNLGDHRGAVVDLNKAISMGAASSGVYNNRGLAKEKLGDLKGAISDYETAVRLDPNSEIAKNNLARAKQATVPVPTQTPLPPSTGTLVTGRYRMIANGVQSEISLTVAGTRFTGTLGAEKITNGTISGNSVTFHLSTRGFSQGQNYTGTFQGKKIVGTFTGAPWAIGREHWPWELDLTPIGQPATPSVTPTPTPSASGFLKSGRYRMTSNVSFHFDLILAVTGNRFEGTDSAGSPIKDGVISGNNVSFRRLMVGLTGEQRYTGTLQGDQIVGTFTGTGQAGEPGVKYPWVLYLNTYTPPAGAVPAPTPRPVSTPRPTPTPSRAGAETEIASFNNVYGVQNSPTAPSRFTIRRSYMVTFIQTYHWNGGRGATPGTIALRKDDGTVYGPWRATGTPAGRNLYWEVRPNVEIPAGTYTITDSNPATWAHNAQSGGRGMGIIKGYEVRSSTSPPPSAERTRVTITYRNASKQTVHIFAGGEGFAPANRLAPGGFRRASGEAPRFTQLTVYAGADGKVIDQLTLDVENNARYVVTYGTNNKLSVRRE